MAKLIYFATTSLDGFIEDAEGSFDWSMPSDEVHEFINNQMRATGTQIYGRRMYETMAVWETMDTGPDQESVFRDFAAIWRAADKVVYSTTLDAVSTSRTRLERSFDPGAVRQMKAAAAADLVVGGHVLAQQAFAAGLVDECYLYLVPVIVGGGKPGLPAGVQQSLTLKEHRSFDNGWVFLRYACAR
jgi:dihydrofolate reductase